MTSDTTHFAPDTRCDTIKVGIVSISDRASSGTYEDKGLPALREWLSQALYNPITYVERLIPDEKDTISQTLIALVDAGCPPVNAWRRNGLEGSATDAACVAGLRAASRAASTALPAASFSTPTSIIASCCSASRPPA